MTLRVDRIGGTDGATDTDLADLVRLRLAWKPASSPEEAATLDRELRDWWHSEGDRRRAWLARHTDGYAVGMANATVFTRMPVPGRGVRGGSMSGTSSSGRTPDARGGGGRSWSR